MCKEGFSGDPDSQRGCNEQTDKSTVRPKEGCIVKNETYAVDEEWDDGCEYKCSCSKKLEILCQVSCVALPGTPQISVFELYALKYVINQKDLGKQGKSLY